ncbi:MAG: hypothetical protein AAGC78_05560, partial [Cellvibrio sp.]|uniref:hypothetical protein n=1 Tax=Cellvibrio sp. TaxID=1965322 RepID=UPI0031B0B67A
MSGENYTDCVETINKLKRQGKISEAVTLLIKCVNATESESKRKNSTPPVEDRFSFLSEGRTESS